jgi:hypothetical protein
MTFRLRMMNEGRLQLAKQFSVMLDVHTILGGSRIEVTKGVFDH